MTTDSAMSELVHDREINLEDIFRRPPHLFSSSAVRHKAL
jgi:hypothetical protein